MSNGRKVVFMYSGQGSHYYQMGRDLYHNNASFRAHFRRLDALAFARLGVSMVDILFDETKLKTDVFNKSAFTNTGIFLIERSLSLVFEENSLVPDYVLGASMGTFAAACQAGCFDEETALDVLLSQSSALEQSAQPGLMIAIMDAPEQFFDHPFLVERSDIASVNFQSHYVIALPREYHDDVVRYLQDKGLVYQELAVEYPYHSRWIERAEGAYRNLMSHFTFNKPSIPLVCCAQEGELPELTIDALWKIARQPIEFKNTINFLERSGEYDYVDLGPAGTLATFLKYLLPKASHSKFYPIITPYEKAQENLDVIQSALISEHVN
ncbi:MAG: acyltransferase domain-containing protein [Agarilytica sp.]